MNRRAAAEKAFFEVLDQNPDGLPAYEVLRAASEIPVEPSRLHRFGNAVLSLLGKPQKPYKPIRSNNPYPTLSRLENQGLVECGPQEIPDSDDGAYQIVYRLKPLAQVINLEPRGYGYDPSDGESSA